MLLNATEIYSGLPQKTECVCSPLIVADWQQFFDLLYVLNSVLLLAVLLALYLFSEITPWPSAVKCRSVALAYYAFQMHLHALVLKNMYDPVNVVILSFLTFMFSGESNFRRSL